MFKPWLGRLLAVALGAFLCVPAALSQPAAATGPWAKVPALSTTCYYDADPFGAKLDAALAAVNADRSKQEAVNQKLEAAYASIDPMERMNRMQQWMMDNPQEATKYMEQLQATGTEMQTDVTADAAAGQRLDAEWNDLTKRYAAALAQANATTTARWNSLLKKLGITGNVPSVKDPGTPAWAIAEEDAILRENDRLYVAACPQWWGAAGPMHAYLKKYRTWLIQEHIPYLEKFDSQTAQTFAMMNTPAASYRSLGTYDGVIKYLEIVRKVFDARQDAPRCNATQCRFA